jgi:hypothetical protein
MFFSMSISGFISLRQSFWVYHIVPYIRLAVVKDWNLSIHPSSWDLEIMQKQKPSFKEKNLPRDTALAITFCPTGGWCQPTYLSKALQQLNNLILTPKKGPYSGQIPTFYNSQSYI